MNIVPSGDVTNHFLRNVVKIAGGNEVKVTSDKLICALNILSFKPKNMLTYFEVCAKNGCKWIYKVRFNLLPPAVDDEM